MNASTRRDDVGFSTICPAKINLGLRVVRRRPDGYHDIETLFVQLKLADRLSFQPAAAGLSFEACGRPIDCPAGRNLVLQAAAEYGKAVNRPVCGRWRLEKRTPVAAGLGGGSSDAAGALRILQRQFDHALEEAALHRLAAELGADVPFFLRGGAAVGTGRGEVLEPIAWPGEFAVVLVTQSDGLSTRDIFADFDAELTSRPGGTSVAFDASLAGLTDGSACVLANDLAGPAFRRMPRLRDVLEALGAAGVAAVGLTGSGPTVFGLARDPRLAREAARLLRRRGWSVLVTGLRRSVPRVVGARD